MKKNDSKKATKKTVKKSTANKTAKNRGLMTAGVITLMCLWVFVAIVASQFLITMIIVTLLGVENAKQPIWVAICSTISYVVAGILIIIVPAIAYEKFNSDNRLSKKKAKNEIVDLTISRDRLGLRDLPTWTDIGISPVGVFASLLLAAGLLIIFNMFPWFDAKQAQNVGFSLYMSGGDRIIAFVTLAVIAPIAEEIIFRGWLYGKIREKLGNLPERANIIISTLVVSILFGAIHGQWNVGVNVFCLSVVLCVLREITGTIYAGILTHMIRNGLAFFMLYVLGIR